MHPVRRFGRSGGVDGQRPLVLCQAIGPNGRTAARTDPGRQKPAAGRLKRAAKFRGSRAEFVIDKTSPTVGGQIDFVRILRASLTQSNCGVVPSSPVEQSDWADRANAKTGI